MSDKFSQSIPDFAELRSETRRKLFLLVADDYAPAFQVLWKMKLLSELSSGVDRRLNAILGWLVKQKLTGQRFCVWLRVEHEHSVLSATKHIIAKLERTEPRPIFADKR